MNFGTSYKQHAIVGDFDVIVIGSGIGGLAAAALLTKHAGKRVLVLERHYTAGGFTHVFHRPGYDWDVGVHYIGDVLNEESSLRLLIDDISNAQIEWADMGDVYDRVIIGTHTFDFVKGKEPFRRQLHEHFPDERQAIDRYLREIDSTVRRAQAYFVEKALPVPLSRLIGSFLRWPLLRKSKRTTLQTLSSFTCDEKLIGILTAQYGDYGLPPSRSSFFIHAMVARHYLNGAAYPVGGAASFARTILPVIEEGGGAVFTNAQVNAILIDNDHAVGVRLDDGKELRAPIVISDAGATNTFRHLLPKDIRCRRQLDKIMNQQEDSTAHLSLYIGLRHTAAELGLSKTNLWIYDDYDHDRGFERMMDDPKSPLPFVYISFPSAKDPDFERRHPGRATIEVISVAPYAWFDKWERTQWKKRGEDYEAFKERLQEQLLERLYAHCPQVKGKVDYAELSTPLTTRHFTNHPRGMIYGLAATPARFEKRWLRPQTPLRNLFLTGSDICSPGVAGALFGGLLTASAITGRNLEPVVAKGAIAAFGSKR
ncbi:MAG: NAD(P)/FAD-dependent oxidoreductase [Pirellulaceae bacterium]